MHLSLDLCGRNDDALSMEWMAYIFGLIVVAAVALAIYERRKGLKLRDARTYEPQTEADSGFERIVNDGIDHH